MAKKDKNGGQAARRLSRILNANFGRGDYLLTLKYDEAGLALVGADYDRGEKQMMLFLRRLAYRFKKRGIKIRYVGCTSEKADRTLEEARLHHHIVISGELISKQEGGGYLLAGEPIESIWGLGSVDLQELRTGDLTGLAVYLCRQARCLPDEKRWHPSRGLKKPRWQDVEASAEGIREYNRHRPRGMPRLIVTADGELAAPPKCAMVEKGPYMPALGSHYIRFLLPEAVGIAPEVPAEERRKRGRRRNGV